MCHAYCAIDDTTAFNLHVLRRIWVVDLEQVRNDFVNVLGHTFGFGASQLLQKMCHIPHTIPKCILHEVHCILQSDPVGFKCVFNVHVAEEGNNHSASSFRVRSDLEKSQQIEHEGRHAYLIIHVSTHRLIIL